MPTTVYDAQGNAFIVDEALLNRGAGTSGGLVPPSALGQGAGAATFAGGLSQQAAPQLGGGQLNALQQSQTRFNDAQIASLTAANDPTQGAFGFSQNQISTGASVVAGVAQVGLGIQGLNIARDQLDFQRESFYANFNQQRQLVNEERDRRGAFRRNAEAAVN